MATEHPLVDLSTTRLIRDIAQIPDHHSPGRFQTAPQATIHTWSTEMDALVLVVPDRPTADILVLCYERYLYPLFPLLHMPTFYEQYELIWNAQGQAQFASLASKVSFYAILNIVLALGCLNNSHIEHPLKQRTAQVFYHRARHLLPLDALDEPSMEVVQYLLLTVIYLSCTKYSSRCCNALAVAIRVAQSLGLHLSHETNSDNQLAREMGKRVWYHCLSLER